MLGYSPAGGIIDAKSQQVQTTARRSASKVMATITPSVTQLLTMFDFRPIPGIGPVGQTFDAYITAATEADFGSAVATALNNPYVHAVTRMMKGLPAAWHFTDLRCQDVLYPKTARTKETKGVELKLVYHRSAKMPYVGTLMWLLRKLEDFAQFGGTVDDGTNGPLKIDPLNYGITPNEPLNTTQLQAAEARLRTIITEKALEIAMRVSNKETEKTSDFPPGQSSGGSPPVFGNIAGLAFDAMSTEIRSGLALYAVNWLASNALDIFLATPDELKTIPITVSVRIPNFNQTYINSGQAWNSNALLLGSFTNQSNMGLLAQKLAEVLDNGKPPNGAGIPYTTP
ncbi:MAG: hypothetical protein NTV34_15280 [Proteobacteria bacterium]|nr:hypothetical protein [Pseudomonadota bacterium]